MGILHAETRNNAEIVSREIYDDRPDQQHSVYCYRAGAMTPPQAVYPQTSEDLIVEQVLDLALWAPSANAALRHVAGALALHTDLDAELRIELACVLGKYPGVGR